MIEIAVEMGVQVINTELAGNPNEPEICEELWYRSMEELLPIVEREGIRMEIQSHPWDFCELGNETADLVKSLRNDHVKYLYSVPHTFYYDKGQGDVAGMLQYAGDDLSHVLIADTMNHTKHCRYIVNPPGVDAAVSARRHRRRRGEFRRPVPDAARHGICQPQLQGRRRIDHLHLTVRLPGKMPSQAVATRERIERELLGK